RLSHWSLVLLAPLFAASPCIGQDTLRKDLPKIHVPLKSATKEQLNHREALKLYGIAVLHERGNRLLEATRVLEQARQLEPDAPAIHRSLATLYLALDRVEDGLAAARTVVSLEPGDFETWYLLARQYRGLNRVKDSAMALDRGLQCVGLKERPDLRA